MARGSFGAELLDIEGLRIVKYLSISEREVGWRNIGVVLGRVDAA